MAACSVMIEAKDTLTVFCDTYQVECHAFANGRQIEYASVGSEEWQVVLSHKTADTGSRVFSIFEQGI